jgi:PAS domain S-box-containing protein
MHPVPPERLLALLAAQSREHAILFISPDARITWWSAGAAHIFGYRAEEIVGEPCDRLFTPEDVARGIPRQEREIALRDDAAEDDRWQQRADGSRFWASGIMMALRDEEGRHVAFGKIVRDRTDVKEQLETLRNRAAELGALAQRKDVFIATLSHELRNPLAPLANAVQIIRLGGEVEYAVKVIERQMAVLQRLVDDTLDLSRVGAGKVELQREPLALGPLLRDAVESCRAAIDKRGHRVDIVLPDAEICIEGDPQRLHQVFVNLITNAAKYTPPGGRIWVKGTVEGEEAVARVEDTGEGIPQDMLPTIFELFTQVGNTRRHAEGGLGIGLALVKNLVTLHGGSVQVKSAGSGKGSEFSVRLPLKDG